MESVRVQVPVADLRSEPSNRSERLSQALYGHQLVVLERRDDFAFVHGDDSYRGWVNAAYLLKADAGAGSESVVTSQIAVFSGERVGRLCLPYGAHVRSGGGDLFYSVDGHELSLVFGRLSMIESVALPEALKEASALVSVPYLWGGTSSFGYDCSGLVQAIYRRCGQILPRDSKDQAACGTAIAFETAELGDLVCFPAHIAVCLGAGRILHSSRRRGGVQIESLTAGDADYRDDLATTITTVRRILI